MLTGKDVQEFIVNNEHLDLDRFVLTQKQVGGVSASAIAHQIASRRKAEYKLPSWFRTAGIVYPPSLNLEQCSSEAAARFKARRLSSWVQGHQSFCDLTCGLGVDALHFAALFRTGRCLEINQTLIELAQHNHQLLGCTSLSYHPTEAIEFLDSTQERFDLIYVDPSRRDITNRKVFRLSDCEPNVAELLPTLLQRSSHIVVKASPLLDIQQGIRELSNVERVMVVAVENECKELLFLINRDFSGEASIECCHIRNSDSTEVTPPFVFRVTEEHELHSRFSDPMRYIYEPDASIMKGGAFKSIASFYSLSKLHVNTHLYTSNELLPGFPGRALEVMGSGKPDKKLRKEFPGGKANVISRNHPLSVADIRKRTGIAEGGELYLIACSGPTQRLMLIAQRLY